MAENKKQKNRRAKQTEAKEDLMFGWSNKNGKRIPYVELTKITDSKKATKLIEEYVDKYKESLFLEMAEHEKLYHTCSGYILCAKDREPNENEQMAINAFLNAKEGDWEMYEEVKKLTNQGRNIAIDFMYAKYAQDLVYMKDKMCDKLTEE